jgi:hypothetical protein
MRFRDVEWAPYALLILWLLTSKIYDDRAHGPGWHFDARAASVLVLYAAFCCVLWFETKRKKRPWWFPWGGAVGGGLLAALPWLHAVLVH